LWCHIAVSFDEFLAMFRGEKDKITMKNYKSFESRNSDDSELIGLNAKIPGGKYDPAVGVGTEQGQIVTPL
jgi:hypothetical protein